MDEEYELLLEQLHDAETAVDKLAEQLREVYTGCDGAYPWGGEIEELFEELELDL